MLRDRVRATGCFPMLLFVAGIASIANAGSGAESGFMRYVRKVIPTEAASLITSGH